jgi:hypothetical protein
MRLVVNSVPYKRIACLAAFVLLGGCGDMHYRHQYPLDPSFGNAVRHNSAAHAVDLDPAWAKDTNLLTDGKRVKKGTDRYVAGEEKALEPIATK